MIRSLGGLVPPASTPSARAAIPMEYEPPPAGPERERGEEFVALLARISAHQDSPSVLREELPRYRRLAAAGFLYPAPDSQTPKLFGAIALAKEVRRQGRMALDRGDPRRARAEAEALVRYGASMKRARGPLLHYLVADAVERMGLDLARDWLDSTAVARADAGRLLAEVRAARAETAAWRGALAAEGAAARRNMRGGMSTIHPLLRDLVLDLERHDEEIRAAAARLDAWGARPYHEIAREAEAWSRAKERGGASKGAISLVQNPRDWIGRLVRSFSAASSHGTLRRRAATDAHRALLEAALRARDLRRRGEAPAETGGTNPFTGRPIESDARGYWIPNPEYGIQNLGGPKRIHAAW